MKKIIALLLAVVLATVLISCTEKKEETTDPSVNPENTEVAIYETADLAAIADSLYDGIAEDNRPFVMSMPLDSETFEYSAFVPYEEGLEAVVNEPMIGSIAHSIVLVKCPTVEKAEEIAKAMKDSCNPRKWVCVEADIVEAVTNKNIAMLLMTTKEGGLSETILENFNALDEEKVASLKSEVFDDEFVDEFEDEYVDEFEDEYFDEFVDEFEDELGEDVVFDYTEEDAGDEPAAMPEEDNLPAVMPEVEAPEVEAPAVEAPVVEAPAADVTIDDLYMLADKLYEGIAPEDMPMVGTMELMSENFEYSAFVPYKDSYLAVESMPMIGAMPHSVVIVKAESAEAATALAADMEANANPRKWICVGARSVKSASKGNLAILVMTSVEVMPSDEISEETAEEMSNTKSEERAQLIIDNFLANA